MKKKIVLSMLSVFFLAVTLIPLSASAGEKVLKLASWGPAGHYVGVQRNVWIKEVNEALAGQIKIVDYPGGQLYGPKEMHMAVAKGSVDIGVILQPAMLAMVPMLQGVYLPFAFDSMDQAAKAYSGESLAIIEKAMEKKRIKLIYTSFLDPVQVFSNKQSINTAEDFQGFRVLSTSPIMTEIFAKLGSAPDASIPQTEQYMALKRGVSDGMLTSAVGGFFQKSFEVAPYITQMNMSFPTILTCMNLNKWKKLPKETQDIMLKLGHKQTLTTLAMGKGWAAKFTGELVKAGATVTTLPAEERAKLKTVSQEVWNTWAAKNGPSAKKLLEINSKL